MSGSNCCFFTCMQVPQEPGKVVWYSHLFKNFPQFVAIHTVKGLSIVNEAKVDFFWNSLVFSVIHWILATWSLVPWPFLNPSWTSGSSQFTYCWSFNLENFDHYFVSVWDECNCVVVWTFSVIALICNWNENQPFPVLWWLLSFPNLLSFIYLLSFKLSLFYEWSPWGWERESIFSQGHELIKR